MSHDNHRPRPRGRNFFRSGELHLVLLALLAEQPRHGYELIADLEDRFDGAYRPSPGSVYPALTALQAEGLLVAEDDGDRRVYRVSTAGGNALERRQSVRAAIEARTGVRLGGQPAEAALGQFVARVRSAAGGVALDSLEDVLHDAATRIEHLSKNGQGNHDRPI